MAGGRLFGASVIIHTNAPPSLSGAEFGIAEDLVPPAGAPQELSLEGSTELRELATESARYLPVSGVLAKRDPLARHFRSVLPGGKAP